MKKRLAMAMLGLMLALGLCACGNDDVKVITKDGVETGAENEKEENGDAEDADAEDGTDAGRDSDDADEFNYLSMVQVKIIRRKLNHDYE